MLKNNKGFMLAEVVVSATIVLTALIALYASFTKLYSLYEIRKNYYDIDGNYVMKGLLQHMVNPSSDNGEVSGDNGNILNEILSSHSSHSPNSAIFLIKEGDKCEEKLDSDTYCNGIKSLYSIENLLLVPYHKDFLSSVDATDTNDFHNSFLEYMDFIADSYDFNDFKYDYLMIMEYKIPGETDEYYYASMGV